MLSARRLFRKRKITSYPTVVDAGSLTRSRKRYLISYTTCHYGVVLPSPYVYLWILYLQDKVRDRYISGGLLCRLHRLNPVEKLGLTFPDEDVHNDEGREGWEKWVSVTLDSEGYTLKVFACWWCERRILTLRQYKCIHIAWTWVVYFLFPCFESLLIKSHVGRNSRGARDTYFRLLLLITKVFTPHPSPLSLHVYITLGENIFA